MAWDVHFRNGLWLPQIGWWLDAHHPVPRSFVSHAHFDHLAPHGEVLCSEGTARLMRARMPAERVERVLPFGQPHDLGFGATITLVPAGHIFGSAQCLIEHPAHGRLLYTGDFKLRPGLSAEPCATPPADVLIMETTYGRPHYRFPPTAEVLRQIIHFCHGALDDGEVPVLFGYSLGKSQEILSGLTQAALPVMLHPTTAKLTTIYEDLGITFPAHRTFDAADVAGHVVICPPQGPSSSFLKKIPRRRTASLTGWALDPGARFRLQCDAAFPLSDHADFPDLLAFVERVMPSRVFTLHGFASDFARTLRERGIDAWAINQDNQLELTLAAPSPPEPAARVDAPPAMVSAPAATPGGGSFDRFADIAESLKATPRKLEKVSLLAAFLADLADDEAGLAALYFTGQPFARADARTLHLGWSVIKRALLDLTGLSEGDYRRVYLQFSDSGDTAEAILAEKTTPSALGVRELADTLTALADDRGALQKLARFQALLGRLAPRTAKYVIKIVTGDLRIGLKDGLVEEAVARSTNRPLEAVREATMLCGDLGAVLRAARRGTLEAISVTPFQPLQVMLASPEPSAAAILGRLAPPIWIEEKYDGIRAQLHKVGSRVELYSRDLHHITPQFPDLAAAARALPGDLILDGELLAWAKGRALPFAALQKRLGRKGGDDFFLGQDIPVTFSCFDLLWQNGESLLRSPLSTRRAALERTLQGAVNANCLLAPVHTANNALEIEAAFLRARERGNEGLMIKDPASLYTPGRRGLAWLKLKKAYATLDVVVVGVEYGHGKRKGVLSDYTFAIRDEASGHLLTVGKAYSGLTDAEIAALTEHFLAHTLEEKGRYRTVVPDTVLEIGFDTIQRSDRHQSGFALRFPRILRIRSDKTPAGIDTLDTCRRLAAAADAFATGTRTDEPLFGGGL